MHVSTILLETARQQATEPACVQISLKSNFVSSENIDCVMCGALLVVIRNLPEGHGQHLHQSTKSGCWVLSIWTTLPTLSITRLRWFCHQNKNELVSVTNARRNAVLQIEDLSKNVAFEKWSLPVVLLIFTSLL